MAPEADDVDAKEEARPFRYDLSELFMAVAHQSITSSAGGQKISLGALETEFFSTQIDLHRQPERGPEDGNAGFGRSPFQLALRRIWL